MEILSPHGAKILLEMSTAVTRNDWVGRVIDGKFPLLEWLGGDEQPGVFRTELNGPEMQSAVIRLMPADREDAEDRLRAWAAGARLSHPRLMRIFESGRVQAAGVALLYVVTEYAEESLAQVIPERPLSTGEAREMLPPILDALSYLHGQGFVHGHIKPSSILVVHDRLKLPVDRIRRTGTESPWEQVTIYDAPEVRSADISPAADIWSLGVTLVEALTQNPPLWVPAAQIDPPVPSEVAQPFGEIARACLRRDPAGRASMGEIRARLDPRRSSEEPASEAHSTAPAEALARLPQPGGETPSRRGNRAKA